ncbi:hypothetical protein ABE85_08280 [Mitsuaria sp. 7]|nr:hypothetical protein ABE85_08280 [Mitsuaria sp. 7]
MYDLRQTATVLPSRAATSFTVCFSASTGAVPARAWSDSRSSASTLACQVRKTFALHVGPPAVASQSLTSEASMRWGSPASSS